LFSLDDIEEARKRPIANRENSGAFEAVAFCSAAGSPQPSVGAGRAHAKTPAGTNPAGVFHRQ
jgi:hypothetical protein